MGIRIVYLVSSIKTRPQESLQSGDLLDEEGVQQGGHAPELLLPGDKPLDVKAAEVRRGTPIIQWELRPSCNSVKISINPVWTRLSHKFPS